MANTECRHFNGYKPCGKNAICDSLCPSLSIPSSRVLIIHLEALGAVLRSTSLLAGIKRKYPDCHITWVTQKPAEQLLKNNPYIDRCLTTERDDLLALSALEFDVAFCIDKSLKAAGVLKQTRAKAVYGFRADPATGAILPATEAARELWELGLDDHRKFFVNQKSETRLSREALELPARQRLSGESESCDEYVVRLNEAEMREAEARRQLWKGARRIVVGLNTGCSSVIPYKKMSIEGHRELIQRLSAISGVRIVLLGGKEDELRNQRIASGLDVVRSSTGAGLRDGLISVQACDIVVTGDSLGMHMAIALKKWVVAWFGPTCAQEIELYGRGEKILSQAPCSPCWKRSCEKSPMCYDLVPMASIMAAIGRGIQRSETRVSRKEHSVDPNSLRRRSPPRDPSAEAP